MLLLLELTLVMQLFPIYLVVVILMQFFAIQILKA